MKMRFRGFPSFFMFAGVTFAISLLQAQITNRERNEMESVLLIEKEDFRRYFFDAATIKGRIDRGVIAVAHANFFVDGRVRESSTNQWATVSDALRALNLLDRAKRTPQIRIIQKDAIVQSSIFLGNTVSGFESSFLDRRLYAGDLIIFTMVFD